MPNEQTTVPLFIASEVLTAADMNLSAGTGVPVFSNTTTRDAGFGGAGEKVLAEGQLCYLSSTNVVQYYDGAAWATVGPSTAGGLVFIGSSTPSAVASASFNSCFSATYQNYRVLINYTSGVGADQMTTMRLRVSGTDSTTGYKSINVNSGTAGGVTGQTDTAGTDEWYVTYYNNGTGSTVAIDIQNPFTATPTSSYTNSGYVSAIGNYYVQSSFSVNNASTSYDGFTILTSGTSFTGTIRVYGYSNS
jgi:hypothetical protein